MLSNSITELRDRIKKINHRRDPLKHPGDVLHVLREYLPLAGYMFRKFGWKSWYTFWYTKLFIDDEGGEFDLRRRWYKWFPLRLRKPFKVEIEHSTVCNKKCIFCAHTHWNETQGQMPIERFKLVIDSIPALKWINIAGIGSAFLHKDFLKMLEYARQKQININFVDEFDFFDEEKAKKIIDLGVNSLYISFDAATKETYESVKKGCDYEKALRNIKTLLKLKSDMASPFPVVHFRYLVTKMNYTEMPDYVELIAGLPNRGARARVEFIGLIAFPGIEDQYIALNEIPGEMRLRVYENALKYNINLYFSHADASCLPAISECVRWSEPFILFDGAVIPDCAILMQSRREFLKKISFGNVFDAPFMDIWNSKRYRDFRKLVVTPTGKVPESCLKCCAFSSSERAEKHGVWAFSGNKTQ